MIVDSADNAVIVFSDTRDGGGVATLVWEDDRHGTVDVFGQNVGPSGVLGTT